MANKSISREEQESIKELFLKLQETRDKETRGTLVEKNLCIAEISVKKYTGRGIKYDDLYRVARIGLIYAVDCYDPPKSYEFSSHAAPTIIGEIEKYLKDRGWIVRAPRGIQELNKRVATVRVYLSQTVQKSPTVGDTADYLSILNEEVLEVLEGARIHTP